MADFGMYPSGHGPSGLMGSFQWFFAAGIDVGPKIFTVGACPIGTGVTF